MKISERIELKTNLFIGQMFSQKGIGIKSRLNWLIDAINSTKGHPTENKGCYRSGKIHR